MLKTVATEFLSPILAAAAAAVLAIISREVVVALRWISKKVGLQVTAGQEAAAQDAARRAVLYVEEWAAKLVEQRIQPAAQAKYEEAAKLVMAKCPWLDSPAVKVLVDSAVAELGVGAAGDAVARKIVQVSAKVAPLAVLLALIFAASGCCTNAGSSATCARKAVTGLYTGIGACSALGLTCDATARAQATAGDVAGAQSSAIKCKTLDTVLHTVTDATAATSKAIDAGEAIGMKDYTAALAPALQSGCSLQKAAQDVSAKVPVVIPCGGL